MQLKTFLILFYTFIIIFVELNDSAPTKSTTTKKPASSKVQKISSQTKPILVGGHTPWNTNIQSNHQKIFNDYKKIILKKLQETHKVPNSFVPKPDKFSKQVVGGINHLYLVKLPINKYAVISIHHRVWKKDHYGKEENVQIRPKLYELNDTSI